MSGRRLRGCGWAAGTMAACCRQWGSPRLLRSWALPQEHQDHQEATGIVFQDTASALFGVAGLQVTDVQAGPGAEQISRAGQQQGTFPQALTHLALISAAFNLDRALGA
jgi:hypothetical protein